MDFLPFWEADITDFNDLLDEYEFDIRFSIMLMVGRKQNSFFTAHLDKVYEVLSELNKKSVLLRKEQLEDIRDMLYHGREKIEDAFNQAKDEVPDHKQFYNLRILNNIEGKVVEKIDSLLK